jgi:hypothetical protein
MAIINPSALLSEIRGNVGNVSFARNRSGPFVRAAINQVNPDTTYQQAIRDVMAAAVINWQGATDEFYQEFEQYVQRHITHGRLSRKFKLSAFNEYVRREINRYLIGGMEDYPNADPTVRKKPWIVEATTDEDELVITTNSLQANASDYIAFYASAPMSAGIRAVNPSWCRFIGSANVTTLSDIQNIYTAYMARITYTGDPNGQIIFVGVKAINGDNYNAGPIQFERVTVQGWPSFIDTFDDTFDETFT